MSLITSLKVGAKISNFLILSKSVEMILYTYKTNHDTKYKLEINKQSKKLKNIEVPKFLCIISIMY